MSSKGLGRAAILTGIALAVFACGISFSSAASAECVQECVDQWESDVAACRGDLMVCRDDIEQEIEDCLNDPANQNPFAQVQCIRDGNVRRFRCLREFRRCVSLANTVAYNCIRACQQSPSE